MNLEEQIALNQFGQSIRPIDDLLKSFSELAEEDKRILLCQLCDLIWQSKPIDEDVEPAIKDSLLKPTFTPCILLHTHRLVIGLPKVTKLPVNELIKGYTLLLHLFRRAYLRRFENEKADPNKWWYADLSNKDFVKSLLTHR